MPSGFDSSTVITVVHRPYWNNFKRSNCLLLWQLEGMMCTAGRWFPSKPKCLGLGCRRGRRQRPRCSRGGRTPAAPPTSRACDRHSCHQVTTFRNVLPVPGMDDGQKERGQPLRTRRGGRKIQLPSNYLFSILLPISFVSLLHSYLSNSYTFIDQSAHIL